LAPSLRRIAGDAEAAGFSSLWVVDHLMPPPEVDGIQGPMLEAYTTLGHLAAVTSRVTLGTLVSGVTQRHPGSLAKAVTTLDVLSGGRAWLGIGAACFAREHAALGIPFPPLAERLHRLQETLEIVLQMWSDDDGPYSGTHYRLAETINSPPPLSRPRPPILVGGGGLRKMLRLVALYADACSLFPDTLDAGLAALREHCEREGRSYDAIEKTVYYRMNLGERGARVGAVLDELADLAERGAQVALCELKRFDEPGTIELVGERVAAATAEL
jgi:F420-dependent oxidoreductase-like protein